MASEDYEAGGVAERYATALYELAEQDGLVDTVADDLRALQSLLDQSADFVRLIRSPVLSREDQTNGVLAVLDKGGAHDLTRRFIGLLAQKRRLFKLGGIIAAYLSLRATRRGEVSAQVVSAKKLTEKQRSALAANLKKAMGNEVAIDARVDPSLLGGLVVKVGSRMVDSSVRTKLRSLKLAMKGVG